MPSLIVETKPSFITFPHESTTTKFASWHISHLLILEAKKEINDNPGITKDIAPPSQEEHEKLFAVRLQFKGQDAWFWFFKVRYGSQMTVCYCMQQWKFVTRCRMMSGMWKDEKTMTEERQKCLSQQAVSLCNKENVKASKPHNQGT